MSKAKLSTDLEYPQNLLYEVFGEELKDQPDDLNATLEYVLSTALKPREKEMVEMRYKMSGTYAQIAKTYRLTRSRIVQIINKAIRILKHPKWRNYLQYGIKAKELQLEERVNEAWRSIEMFQKGVNPYDIKCERDIETLKLSTRAFLCLKRAGIEAVKDILSLSPNELLHIRNLGRKSLFDIIDTLERQGYDVSKFKTEFGKEYKR